MLKLMLLSCFLIGVVNLTDVTYYEILGVAKKASAQEIRQAYKKLAVKFHPDKNPDGEKQEEFLKITEAYETLKDPDKRQKYDLYGSHTYTRKYDYHSQAEYDNVFYNGLYHNDPFVETLSGSTFYNYLKNGFHFINFYSPFCPPCQNVADHWKKLAEMYEGIVKVGAVNCKYHNSFCYNNMRIGSYPTLLFYPNGKDGNYVYYRGERTLEALDEFLMTYLKSQVHVPTVTRLRSVELSMAYVLGANRIDRGTLTRIAYHLNGMVTVAIVEDDDLRGELASDDYTTVVFKYNEISKEIESTDEKEILKEIVDALPRIDLIGPDKLKEIRNNLRSGARSPWVLYFTTKGVDRLLLHQMRIEFPHMNFGEIDCDRWGELCSSLHVEAAGAGAGAGAGAWGVLKRGGAYQRAAAAAAARPRDFIAAASRATRLHTLSPSEFNRILNGEAGVWVVLVAPHAADWSHAAEPLARASLHFTDTDLLNFGIMSCTLSTDEYCRRVAGKQLAVLVQNGTKRHYYNGREYEQQLVDFVHLLKDSADIEMSEQQVLAMSSASGRARAWLVAFLPPRCGAPCDQLLHQWRLVAKKLRPLEFVRVGVLNCGQNSGGFCGNVRAATARYYPIASERHYSVSLQHLSEAPYMLEWALEYIDDSVVKLNWHLFTKSVIAEELNPSSGKKPWLVYFHSPRCYRCYEMYADFAITGILLHNAVQVGKVNCVNERSLCQHEQVMGYPSLKLYLNRNPNQRFSSVVNIQVADYESMLQEITPHLAKYDENLLAGFESLSRKGFDIKHDEF